MTTTNPNKAHLHVIVATDIRNDWQDTCDDAGVTMSATIACLIDDLELLLAVDHPDQLRQRARAYDVANKRRRRDR